MKAFKNLPLVSALIIMILAFPVIAESLNISFSSQAPIGNWTGSWQNTCEETSILIVDAFYNNQELNLNSAEQGIANINQIKETYFGKSKDEEAGKIAQLINNFFNWEADVVASPTVEQMKEQIQKKHPIILPAYGKYLKNPYFLNGGPDYHVLVISGYDDINQEFITQEPGTQYGRNLRYSYETIIDAMHDFVAGNKTKTGAKVAIFTSPEIKNSASLDGDLDGLTKSQELRYKTSLISSDTDQDGYLDKEEIDNGFSPTVAELQLKSGSLLRSANTDKVYLMNKQTKQHIINEQALINNGWNWEQVITVSETFLNKFQEDAQIK